ncbi:MAG: hypothetical protein ACWGQW_04210 [bacterium]
MSVQTSIGSEVTLVTYLADNLHSDGVVECQAVLSSTGGTYERPTFNVMRLTKDGDFSGICVEIPQSRVLYLESAIINEDNLVEVV